MGSMSAYDKIADTIAAFQYDHPYGYNTSGLPLGRDMSGGVLRETVHRLGRVVGRAERELLQNWAADWEEASGEVEVVGGAVSSSTRAYAFLSGPAISIDRGLYAPGLRYDVQYRRNGTPRGLNVRMGYVNANSQFSNAAERVTFAISEPELLAIRYDYPEVLREETLALGALTAHAYWVITAAQDPLKVALPDVHAANIARHGGQEALPWMRAGHGPQDDPEAIMVEVYLSGVDPERYGEGRYAAFVRESRPDSPLMMFTGEEWDAFVGGAKDGEFDLD